MSVQETIHTKLGEALAPVHLDVVNESDMHNVPKGSQTHFKVVIVSTAFEGLGLVDRHRRVHEILQNELKKGVHALSIKAMTPAQWTESGAGGFVSPPCLGGSKAG